MLRAKAAKGFASSCSYDDLELEKTQQANWVQLRSGAGSISLDQGFSMDGDAELTAGGGAERGLQRKRELNSKVERAPMKGNSRSLMSIGGEGGQGSSHGSRSGGTAGDRPREMIRKLRR